MTPALEIENLQAWYGESHILHGVSLTVQPGEVVTLLGRNGAGRTTTLRAIMGLTGARSGSIKVNGVEAIRLPTHRIAHLEFGFDGRGLPDANFRRVVTIDRAFSALELGQHRARALTADAEHSDKQEHPGGSHEGVHGGESGRSASCRRKRVNTD